MNDKLNDINISIKKMLKDVKNEVEKINSFYSSLFIFENMFTTESSGKTRLNRKFYNKVHGEIKNNIYQINSILSVVLEEIRDTIVKVLDENGFKDIVLDKELVYDDASFYELFKMDLELVNLEENEKVQLVDSLDTLTEYKNKIHNIRYFISMFDTSYLNKYLNKLGMDDLINNKFIFELIDSYGLQFEGLKRFDDILENFYNFDKETKDFSLFSSPIELVQRRIDNYVYDNVRYKILLEYDNQIKKLKKPIELSIAYLENIIVNFIEQSCLDLIKKELKRGKISKIIEIKIIQTHTSVQLAVRNNGFEEKDIHTMYLGSANSVNNYIVKSRNLARMMGGTVDISTLENTGMQYIFDLKIK
ncbi:hypothetical protein ACH5BK_04565 [Arcobacter sp. YIC-80]|uniref:hypothetical protein n=1 Tax=Arcobacter sp. YIC-80 TaxID=3376683 RepID=UPI00384B4821